MATIAKIIELRQFYWDGHSLGKRSKETGEAINAEQFWNYYIALATENNTAHRLNRLGDSAHDAWLAGYYAARAGLPDTIDMR